MTLCVFINRKYRRTEGRYRSSYTVCLVCSKRIYYALDRCVSQTNEIYEGERLKMYSSDGLMTIEINS